MLIQLSKQIDTIHQNHDTKTSLGRYKIAYIRNVSILYVQLSSKTNFYLQGLKRSQKSKGLKSWTYVVSFPEISQLLTTTTHSERGNDDYSGQTAANRFGKQTSFARGGYFKERSQVDRWAEGSNERRAAGEAERAQRYSNFRGCSTRETNRRESTSPVVRADRERPLVAVIALLAVTRSK